MTRKDPTLPSVVIDTSALVEILLRTPRSRAVLRAVGGAELVAPDLINVEVLSTLRRLVSQTLLSPTRADHGMADLVAAPLRRLPTAPLLPATWQLRANLSMYDACYVALAGALGCPVVTSDERIAHAPRLPAPIIVP